jgi:hypothetical protein
MKRIFFFQNFDENEIRKKKFLIQVFVDSLYGFKRGGEKFGKLEMRNVIKILLTSTFVLLGKKLFPFGTKPIKQDKPITYERPLILTTGET